MTWAVFTGDIVGSSSTSGDELNELIAALAELFSVKSGMQALDISLFSRRGGDGWQAAHDSPHLALRTALLAQATLKSLNAETRIAVGVGDGVIPDGPAPDLNAAYGPAFQASGRLLDGLHKRQRMGHASGGAHHAAFCLADEISQGWTQAQARALAIMLRPDPGPRRKAAAALGITRQAVDQALHGAGYPALMAAIEAMEEARP